MIPLEADPGSFRDPGGRIYTSGEKIFRAVMSSSADDYATARAAGILATLVEQQLLLPFEEIDPSILRGVVERPAHLLEHPRLPFISYPYEWSFSQLRAAALLHLDLHLAALEGGFTLSDATAYNVQFIGSRPVFIDHLSVRPYHEGEIWLGHRQFCMQFLNPLILWSRVGVSPNSWFRGSLEGIAPEDVSRLLAWRHNLSWTVLAHVTLQAAMRRRQTKQGHQAASDSKPELSRTAFKATLVGLRHFIASCKIPQQKTDWSDYSGSTSYAEEEARLKRMFVSRAVEAIKPDVLLDLGCNTGDYSVAALEAGAKCVVGFDYDFGALELAFERSRHEDLAFTPLWLDGANPSPSQGWAERERRGFAERVKADASISLAFIHHIAIARNVPLWMVVDWLIGLAPTGVLEFPPKSDPMVQQLLARRDDIFPDYTEENFMALVSARARVVESLHLSPGGRLLVWYDRTGTE